VRSSCVTLSSRVLPAVIAIAALAASARAAEPSFLSPDLESALSRSSAAYRAIALKFACTEKVRSVSYHGDVEDRPRETREYPYLLERAGDGRSLAEYRDGRHPGFAEGVPPPRVGDDLRRVAALLLSFRDLGLEARGLGAVRRIGFRGALPFSRGRIQGMGGTLTLDARTLFPLEVAAVRSSSRSGCSRSTRMSSSPPASSSSDSRSVRPRRPFGKTLRPALRVPAERRDPPVRCGSTRSVSSRLRARGPGRRRSASSRTTASSRRTRRRDRDSRRTSEKRGTALSNEPHHHERHVVVLGAPPANAFGRREHAVERLRRGLARGGAQDLEELVLAHSRSAAFIDSRDASVVKPTTRSRTRGRRCLPRTSCPVGGRRPSRPPSPARLAPRP